MKRTMLLLTMSRQRKKYGQGAVHSYTIPTTDNNLRKLYDSKKAKAVIDSLK